MGDGSSMRDQNRQVWFFGFETSCISVTALCAWERTARSGSQTILRADGDPSGSARGFKASSRPRSLLIQVGSPGRAITRRKVSSGQCVVLRHDDHTGSAPESRADLSRPEIWFIEGPLKICSEGCSEILLDIWEIERLWQVTQFVGRPRCVSASVWNQLESHITDRNWIFLGNSRNTEGVLFRTGYLRKNVDFRWIQNRPMFNKHLHKVAASDRESEG
jgi:hypothetical protein